MYSMLQGDVPSYIQICNELIFSALTLSQQVPRRAPFDFC